MEYRTLGGSGLKVPVLTLGTGTFGGTNEFFRGFGTTDVSGAARLVDICLEAGVTMFDSADVYSDGLAEEILGKAIAGKRDRVLISTKGAMRTGSGPNDIGSSRHHLVARGRGELAPARRPTTSISTSCTAFDALTPIDETLRALDDLVRAGKLRYLGCSNFSGWHLMKSLAHRRSPRARRATSRIRRTTRWSAATTSGS